MKNEIRVRNTPNQSDDAEGAPPGNSFAGGSGSGRSDEASGDYGSSIDQDSWITIIRNTEASAPNITLNRPEGPGDVELRIFAAFGILLQLGVVLFMGFITYYPTLRFEKNNRPVPRYAFPLTATGTFLLVLGMLICAHVVDSSTGETYYEVLGERKVQLVWLQQANNVSDQVFSPVAIHRRNPCTLITTSSRVIEDERDTKLPDRPDQLGSASSQQAKSKTAIEWKAILGTIICLSGFVIQFVGLRSMHWSASIAQLVAVFTMTVLRTVARRGFTNPLDSHNLMKGHELDWFVLTLADLENASWCKALIGGEDGASPESPTWDFATWVSDMWNRLCHFLSGANSEKQKDELVGSWIVTRGPYDEGSETRRSESSRTESNQSSQATSDQNYSHLETSNRRTAQDIMDLRKDLAQLSNWRGPAAEEAIALAQAMEVVLNALYNAEKSTTNTNTHFTWNLKVKFASSNGSKPDDDLVRFNFSWDDKRKWKARADEIEAALSLWLYSTKKQETPGKPGQLPPLNDSWLREKGLRPKLGYRQLGSYTSRLAQDLWWWMPSEGFNVLKSTSKRKENEEDQRGTTELYDWEPLHPTPGGAWSEGYDSDDSDALIEVLGEDGESSDGSVLAVHDEDGGSSDGHVLAVESYDVTEKAYAKDMFSAFMWTVAEKIKTPIDNTSKLQTVGGEGSGRGSLRSARLQSQKLSKLAQDIQKTGLESLNDAYLSIIPPFSKYERLPGPNAVTEQACEQGKEFERLQQWENASHVYAELLDIATVLSEDTPIYNKAVAICVRYLKARESNSRIREFHDWGELYDYPEQLKKKPEKEEAGLTRRLEKLEKLQRDFKGLRSDLEQLFDFRLDSKKAQMTYNGGFLPGDVMGRTLLHYAAAEGNEYKATFKSIASSNVMDIRGLTPLHYACKYGHTEMAELLVGKGAKVDVQDYDGLSPLHLAALNDHYEVVEKLIKLGGSTRLRDNYGRLPIHCSAMEGHVPLVRRFVADAKATDNRGRTALHYAAWFGKTGVLEELISDGHPTVDLETTDYLDATALHLAAEKGHDEIVKHLIGKGSNTKAKSSLWNSTPLHLAAARGHSNVIIALVEKDPEARKIEDSNGRTPLEVAQWHESEEQILVHPYLDTIRHPMTERDSD